ncbi:MAG: TrbI/VirB10 family protein [Alphaproteobacteria bacterium]|nr:TrbI/VirB10 family protein [Alphaproteobacteria bacterium]
MKEGDGKDLENEGLESESYDDESKGEVENQEVDMLDESQDAAEDLDEEYVEEDKNQSQISQIKSLVSQDPRKSMMMLVVFLVVMGGVIYYFFYDKSSDVIPTTGTPSTLDGNKGKEINKVVTPKVVGSSAPAPEYSLAIDPSKLSLNDNKQEDVKVEVINNVQSPPKPADPKSPGPAPSPAPSYQAKPSINQSPQVVSSAPEFQKKTDEEAKQKAKDTKLKSSLMLVGGKSEGASAKGSQDSQNKTRDLSANFSVEASTAPVSRLTKVGNMSHLITQGKIIEAVLETPVNTNYKGPIRAVISRDVYSELGENVLIPKGSRVIGNLIDGYRAGQTRVLLKWSRVILPSGYDIKVEGSPGVDKLGMIGIEGVVDRQFWNTLGNTVLLSALNVSLAKVLESEFGVSDSTSTTTVATDGSQTTNSTSTATQDAIKDQIDDISDGLKNWVTSNFATTPFITVDQGTVVKIFVNADIQFPSDISSGVNILK